MMGALRNLSVSEQVGLLFVALFGVLALVTVIALVRTLRDSDAQTQETQHSFNRDLRAVWVASVIFWTAWAAGALVSTLLFGIVSFIALRELITLTHTRRADHRSLLLAFFVVLPIQYVLVAWQLFDLFTVFIPVYVFLAIPVVSALANDPTRFLERNAKLQWGIMVCIYGMSHVPALLLLDFPNYDKKNAFLVFFLVIVVQTCVVAQHFASRYFKAPPAAPNISQSFNWRSWLVALLVAGLAGAVLSGITPFFPAQGFVMAVIACTAGTLGHFVMKALKRDRGIPSWGGQMASVTGAGGLLDRVDALCFAAPVFFHSVRWYFDL
jgi:phosphatidate cytidylyltransferase